MQHVSGKEISPSILFPKLALKADILSKLGILNLSPIA